MSSQPKPWQDLYRAAVLETSTILLPERIDVAMSALRDRLQEIGHAADERQERSRVECAIHMLELLRRVELRHPFRPAA